MRLAATAADEDPSHQSLRPGGNDAVADPDRAEMHAHQDCPGCRGSAVVKTPDSMGIDVVRTLIVIAQKPAVVKVTVTVVPEVADYLNNRKRHELTLVT